MNNSENNLFEINEKLEMVNQKITFVLDSFLNMKNEFDTIKKGNLNKEYISKFTYLADEKMSFFLKKRASECEISDMCTTMVEKGIFRALRTYNEKGATQAIKMIDSYLDFGNKESSLAMCCDKACYNNSIVIFNTLKELLSTSKAKHLLYREELNSIDNDSIFEEGSEEIVYQMLKPLSNVLRLKILKCLRKGGKYYTQLEEEIGIKAGHLLFHVEKLINGGYVFQESKKYMITLKGLKILKFLFQLRAEFLIIAE